MIGISGYFLIQFGVCDGNKFGYQYVIHIENTYGIMTNESSIHW